LPVTDPADEESGTAAHNQIFEFPINLGEVSSPTCQAITSITVGFIGFRRRNCNREPTAETDRQSDRQTDRQAGRQFKYPISSPLIKVLLRKLPLYQIKCTFICGSQSILPLRHSKRKKVNAKSIILLSRRNCH
jgi:hypothetical protein